MLGRTTGGIDDRLSPLTAIVFLFCFEKSSDAFNTGLGKMLSGLCIDRYKVLFEEMRVHLIDISLSSSDSYQLSGFKCITVFVIFELNVAYDNEYQAKSQMVTIQKVELKTNK